MEIIILIYYIIGVTLFLLLFNIEKISPVTIFIASQVAFFTGLIKYLNFSNSNDIKIMFIYILGLLSFGLGSLFGNKMKPYSNGKKNVLFIEKPLSHYQKNIASVFIAFSLLLCLFFCYKTRLSTVRTMFSNLFLGGDSDITDLRIASYNVPGTAIIYAFRIAILPAITIALIRKENNYSLFTKIALTIFMVFFTLITGQRGGFVMVMFAWILTFIIPLFFKKSTESNRKMRRNATLVIILFFGAFYFLSLINGRISDNFLGEIIQRFFDDNQGTAYYAFQYIFDEGTCFGRNYYEEIVNLITSGDKYLPLSKIIFNIMYGSTRGTAPACLWGSLFYNFSWFGVLVFGFLYGCLCHYIGYRLYSRPINSIRLSIYSYMFICMGMLVAGGPLQLFNNGFVPLVILAWVMHVDKSVENMKL